TIQDFLRGTDRIDLRSIDASTKTSGNQAFSFIGSKSFAGHAGELNFVSGVLSGDVNGDRTADFRIKVAVSSLAAGGFYLLSRCCGGGSSGEGVDFERWPDCVRMERPGYVFEVRNGEGRILLTPCTVPLQLPFDWTSPPV